MASKKKSGGAKSKSNKPVMSGAPFMKGKKGKGGKGC